MKGTCQNSFRSIRNPAEVTCADHPIGRIVIRREIPKIFRFPLDVKRPTRYYQTRIRKGLRDWFSFRFSNPLFHSLIQFLTSVGTVLVQEKDISIVQNRLRRHFNITSSTYLCSNEFHSLLTDTQHLFESNDTSIKHFTLLASLDKQLKHHPIEVSTKRGSTTPISLTAEQTVSNKPSDLSSPTASHEEKRTGTDLLNSCDQIEVVLEKCTSSITIEMIPTTADQPSTSRQTMRNERKILKLENRLGRLSRLIRELEKQEMTLDEMQHCDLYVVESKFKKKAFEVTSLQPIPVAISLCSLGLRTIGRIERGTITSSSNSSSTVNTARYVSPTSVSPQPWSTLLVTEIGHPLLHKALEDLVNAAKFFPSFHDVLETVEKLNEKHRLQWR